VCASEGCGICQDGRSRTYRCVNSAVFPRHDTVHPFLRSPRLLRSVVARFGGGFVPDASGNCNNLDVKYQDKT
jgi:hypothetical protein